MMKFFLVLVTVLLFTSCGGDDKAEVVEIPGDTATTADLAVPSNPGTATSAEMTSFMDDDAFLATNSDKMTVRDFVATASSALGRDASAYRVKSISEDEEDSISECFSMDSILLEATGDTISIKKVLDISSCLQPLLQNQVGQEGSIQIKNTSFGINLKLKCVGADLSNYNGKKFSEMQGSAEDISALCGSSNASMYLNMVGKIDYKASLGENSLSASADIKVVIASATGANCAITKVDDGHSSNNCIHINGSVVNLTTNGKKEVEREFQKIVFNNVVEPDDEAATYFLSGTQTVTYRNWTGTVTHTGTGFSYDFTNGTDNVAGAKGTK